jgi:hypothetical protein
VKRIQHANVMMLPGNPAELFIKAIRIASCQSSHGFHAQQFKIAHHRRPNRNQIEQRTPRISLYIRFPHSLNISRIHSDSQVP